MAIRSIATTCLALLLLFSAGAGAQQARLVTDEGPYYAGVPIAVQVVADGFEESPEPSIEAAQAQPDLLQLRGVSPNISTSVQIINGRMSQSKTVRFIFHYVFQSNTSGQFSLGPFRVRQNGRQASTGTVSLKLGDIPMAANQRIRLLLPEGPVYVGQQVPLTLEWWIHNDLRGKIFNQTIQLPLLGMREAFQFSATEDAAASTRLSIDSPAGAMEFPATVRVEDWNGEQYVVYSIAITMKPAQAGEYPVAAASVSMDEAIRWRRDLFGKRVPTHAQKRRVSDQPRMLKVDTPPLAGRPASFSGAVGKGFSLQVAADRSVVQIGDPITLTLTLRGDAAVESVSLPDLASAGLSATAFRLPDGDLAGVYQDGVKRFQASVRVLDKTVREIPALAFSWFDSERHQYQTAYSQPIALSVRDAQIVSADDVVSNIEQSDPPTDRQARQRPASEADGAHADNLPQRRFSLSGADLAIHNDVAALLTPAPRGYGNTLFLIACYGIGLGAIALAVLYRRRAAIDPAVKARIHDLKEQRKRLAQVSGALELATALRRIAALASALPRTRFDGFDGFDGFDEFDKLLADCETLAYAPGGGAAKVDDELRQRALTLADTLLGQVQ